jgi:hypothetical protein
MKRNINNFSTSVLNFISLLCFDIKNIYLMGTMSEKQMLYPSDYDLFEKVHVKYKNIEDALDYFQDGLKKIVRNVKNDSDCYISGIMLGLEDEKPKKWDTKTFLESDLKYYINQPSLIKIDAIKLTNGIFSDYSCVYQFYNNDKLINKYKLFQTEDLERDIDKFRKEGNYYKMAKRLYTIDGDEKYTKLFNSDLGKLSQAISHLQTLSFMLEHHKISFVKLNEEINMIIERLNSIYEVPTFTKNETKYINTLKSIQTVENNKKNYKKIIKKINSLTQSLNSILQKRTKKYLKL